MSVNSIMVGRYEMPSPEVCELFQKLAFKNGFAWQYGDRRVKVRSAEVLYLYSTGHITWGDVGNSFHRHYLPLKTVMEVVQQLAEENHS